MLSIKEKLAYFDKKRPENPDVQTPVSTLDDGRAELGIKILQTDRGDVFVREKTILYPHYTAVQLNAFLDLEGIDFTYIGKNWQYKDLNPQNVLFIDTETTGLAGGTGTYIFLAGFARFNRDHVLVRQFFMPDQSYEYPFLRMVQEEINHADALISYNGKSYDLPLLKTRFILNRLHFERDDVPHLDLLHASRRLWKSLDSYSLSNMEEQILKVRREGDVPGYQIPGIYFQSLITRDVRPLKPVFQHNVMDLLSLAGIIIEGAKLFKSHENRPTASIISVMRTFEALNLLEQAAAFGNVNENNQDNNESFTLIKLHKARYLKKMRRMDEAVQVWREIISSSTSAWIEPYIELAKYYEHFCQDIHQALHYIERAESRIQIRQELYEKSEEDERLLNEFAVRKTRLRRKSLKNDSTIRND